MALGMRIDASPARVWVLMGDSEIAEGSVWEAMATATYHEVDNLIAVLDMNRLGQRGPTMLEWDGDHYARRARAFGWQTLEIDGHDVEQIDEAYRMAEAADAPVLIVARTVKGKGVSLIEDKEGWHGRALSQEQASAAIQELGGERSLIITPPAPSPFTAPLLSTAGVSLPIYDDGVATRKAFGETLAALAARRDVVVLDGEVSNSTYTEDFEKVAPERFLQMFIGEQNMVGAATGLQVVGKRPVAATFGAFLTRAYDFVRMAAVSRAHLLLNGSHAGVSIGEDGPSQMALEDIAMMRAVHGSTVVYPADGNSTARLAGQMIDLPGVSYIRTTRERTPKLYDVGEEFPIGGSKTLRSSSSDQVTLASAGATLFEALNAADDLEAAGTPTRVLDLYSIKPIDATTLRRALEDTGLLVVVEDHWLEGGIGDAVLAALADGGNRISGRVVKLGVSEMPGSASPEEQRRLAGIAAPQIMAAVQTALAPATV
jgi:transketolase